MFQAYLATVKSARRRNGAGLEDVFASAAPRVVARLRRRGIAVDAIEVADAPTALTAADAEWTLVKEALEEALRVR